MKTTTTISKMETNIKTLYPAEVQRAIFNQLITYENLLADGYSMDISRPSSWEFWVYVYPKGNPMESHSEMFPSRKYTTAKELDGAVSRWWESIPKECKR